MSVPPYSANLTSLSTSSQNSSPNETGQNSNESVHATQGIFTQIIPTRTMQTSWATNYDPQIVGNSSDILERYRSRNWTYDETIELISKYTSDEWQLKFSYEKKNHRSIWIALAASLTKRKDITGDEARQKINNMKAFYSRLRRQLLAKKIPFPQWEFWEPLHSFLSRPLPTIDLPVKQQTSTFSNEHLSNTNNSLQSHGDNSLKNKSYYFQNRIPILHQPVPQNIEAVNTEPTTVRPSPIVFIESDHIVQDDTRIYILEETEHEENDICDPLQQEGEERNVDLPSLVGGMNESSMGLLDNDTTEDQPLPPSPEQFLTEAEDSGNINSPNINQRPESYKLRHNNHLHLVLESLADDESFMDVTLTAQGKLIKAHKSVLSAVSPYFKGVLKQNPCQHPIIIMPRDIKFEELSSIIGYIYRGEITIAVEELPSLLKTAEILQVSGLSTSEASAVGGLAAHLLSRVQSSNLPFANHSSFKPKAQRKPKSFSKTKKELANPDPELLNPVDFLNQDMSFIKEEITTEIEANPMTDDDECHAPMDSNDNEEASGSGSIPSTKLKDNNDSPPDTKIDSSSSSTLSSQLPYQCPHCFEIKRPLSVLETHMFTKHPSKPCFICKKCYKVFVRQSLFQTHSKICD